MATYESVIDVNDQQEDAVEVPLGGEGDVEKENNKNSRLWSIVWKHFPYVKGAKKHNANIVKWF